MAKAPIQALNVLPNEFIDISQLTDASTYKIRDITNHDMSVEDFVNGMQDAANKYFKTALFMRLDGLPIENDTNWQTLRSELRNVDRTPQGKLTVTRDNASGMVTISWP